MLLASPLRLQLEADVLRQRAIAPGLSPSDLLPTAGVRNTTEEASAIPAVRPSDAKVGAVISAFHMRRARRLFERQNLQLPPVPVDFGSSGAWAGHPLADPLRWLASADGLSGSRRALRELFGRTMARA